MTEYSVLFVTKISAKSKSDLDRKAESTAEAMSKCLKKKVYPYGYGLIEKKDQIQSTLEEST
ncbi:MAG: hypothetical protein IJF83_10940 [Methanobrevibacter sp.]|nr:hypothetical protein [Methanobrevibacter sp.]